MKVAADKRYTSRFDALLLAAILALTGIGLYAQQTATRNVERPFEPSLFFYQQLIWFGLALIVLVFSLTLDFRFWRRVSWALYLGNVVLLAALPFVGKRVGGAGSWIGIGHVGIQPSEFAKLLFIVTFADFLARNRGEIDRTPVLVLGVFHFLIPFGLILLQPDMGTAMVFAAIFFAMLFVSGLDGLRFFTVLTVMASGAFVAAPLVLKDYQLERLMSFARPEADPLGAGYQLIQSKIAIGSGGLFGVGLFKGLQAPLGYLPAARTDFIFSVLAEETGLAGSAALIALFAFLLYRAARVGVTSGEFFANNLAVGVVAMIGFQLLVSVAMALGFFPITGIPMPLVSYGGSSLLTTYASFGLILNISMRRKEIMFG